MISWELVKIAMDIPDLQFINGYSLSSHWLEFIKENIILFFFLSDINGYDLGEGGHTQEVTLWAW